MLDNPDSPVGGDANSRVLRFPGLDALRARMDLIATYPIHVNAAYLETPPRRRPKAADSISPEDEK